ncbi:MAG: XRE family transcriptional regulator [Acidobacteria bacterium]|nr:XRE family transcriptional regulator [Acidobacteriota bacterium]
MTLQGTDAVDVGARLRGAREATGLMQSDVAADLRVARTTLVAIEQGRRPVRTDELQRLARLYGTSVNALLRREAVHVDLVPRFRRLWTTNDESMEQAARLMTDLVRAEVELENLHGVARTRNYPPARPSQAGDVRLQPDVCRSDRQGDTREERYADAFGRAFLTPSRTVRVKFEDITAGASRFTRRHVILLAHAFGVSREAIVRRLEELRLVKAGTWEWFAANGGITDEQARQVLGRTTTVDYDSGGAQRPVSLRLGLLAGEAERRKLLSEGQLARLLCLDRVELRKILDAAGMDEDDADGPPKLPR